ncbi:MAG: XRE family transcriptional regulator [Gemmatimonadota bacterium]|nr:XRE family transcriptional regulator [Gemmatimonadota bacterium]
MIMRKAPNPYGLEPAVPPGHLLATHLAGREMSQAECARRCGRSAKLISEIVSGKAPIQPETALQLERVLGLRSDVWLGIESEYRLLLARRADAAQAETERDWLASFPVGELIERGMIEKRDSVAGTIDELLAFFGVASIRAWRDWYGSLRIVIRPTRGAHIHEFALASWLRLGEIESGEIPCAEYSAVRFRKALTRLGAAARRPKPGTWKLAQELCQAAGVALVKVEPLPRAPIAGTARWLTPRKALIQIGGGGRVPHRPWFMFFHEAAHLLLHSKKVVFVDPEGAVDANGGGPADVEAQADAWAVGFPSH